MSVAVGIRRPQRPPCLGLDLLAPEREEKDNGADLTYNC